MPLPPTGFINETSLKTNMNHATGWLTVVSSKRFSTISWVIQTGEAVIGVGARRIMLRPIRQPRGVDARSFCTGRSPRLEEKRYGRQDREGRC